jgi:hypothetical protein
MHKHTPPCGALLRDALDGHMHDVHIVETFLRSWLRPKFLEGSSPCSQEPSERAADWLRAAAGLIISVPTGNRTTVKYIA